ncbi:unnamed protein product [Ectocarpus sp. CCAP 1310/34]|nr:unnamed protein product [Ectocarpus sp. CCAP 1310/34]
MRSRSSGEMLPARRRETYKRLAGENEIDAPASRPIVLPTNRRGKLYGDEWS